MGHLDTERLELEGIEFTDPRDAGADPEYWGPAARKSRTKYVNEYAKMKESKASAFGVLRERVSGFMARISGNAPDDEVGSIEV